MEWKEGIIVNTVMWNRKKAYYCESEMKHIDMEICKEVIQEILCLEVPVSIA